MYGASIAALPVALILATPVLTRQLGPAGFGTVDVLSGLVALAAICAGLGMDSAVARSWFDDTDHRRQHGFIRTGLAVVSAASGIAALLGFALFAIATRSHVAAAAVAFGAMPLVNAQAIARLALQLTRRRAFYLAASLLHAGVGVGAALVLVLLGAGVTGYFAGTAAGAFTALAFTLGTSRLRSASRRLERTELRRMFAYGLPLIPAAAASWAIFAVDRTLVAALRNFDEAGLYGLGAKVTAPMMLFTSAFAVAWAPFIFGQPPARRRDLRARALTAVVAGSAALLVCIVVFAPELVDLLGGGDFAEARDAVPGVALGWMGWAAGTVLATTFAIERRTRVIGVVTSGAAIVNVGLNLVLIPEFGFEGAAWATAASFGLLALAYAVWEHRGDAAPYRFGRLAAVAGIAGASCAAAALDDVLARLVVCVAAVAALVAVAASDRERP